jgi:hypothetical protein
VRLQAWARGAAAARRYTRFRRALVRLQRASMFSRLKRRFKEAELPLARLQACVPLRAA